jgi:hypothetical protein
MKSNEFRLGNLIKGRKGRIIPLIIHDLNLMLEWERIEYSRTPPISPVLLTDDLLLKLGFYKRKACGNYWFEKSHKKLLFLTNDINPKKGFAYSTKVDHVFVHDINWHKKIKYVHQLQNLYFALTGNELTLTN